MAEELPKRSLKGKPARTTRRKPAEQKKQVDKAPQDKESAPERAKDNAGKPKENAKTQEQKQSTQHEPKKDSSREVRLLEVIRQFADWSAEAEASGKKQLSVREIRSRVRQILKAENLTEFGDVGEKYQSSRHQVMVFVKEKDTDPGVVIEVKAKGLREGRRIVLPAKVIVSK